MPRLPITQSVRNRLYANSANQCAFPGCNEKLYDNKTNLSNICHIEAAENGGQRFNSNNSNEYNRSYENLILLCTKHHKITDDVDEYPVEKLQQMKADHEQRVAAFNKSFNQQAKYLLLNVAFDPKEMVGRTEKIEELRQQMFSGNATVLVNGLGGIGKTTLAKAYAHKYRNHYQHILWVSKQSQHIYDDILDAPTITLHLNPKFAEHIANPKLDRSVRMAYLQQALLELQGPNLLVLDNVENELSKPENTNLLPNQPSQWHIIGTSRQTKHLVSTISLDVLPETDAIKLFTMHCPSAKTDAALPALLNEIGYHTLSITLLAKTMNSPICSLNCTELTELIKNHQWESSELQATIIDNYSNEEQTVFKHLDAAFSLANLNNLEIIWLKHFVVMPAQGYTLNFLMEITGFNKTKEVYIVELKKALQQLINKGWIQYKENEKLFECHRLVQEVLLHKPKINIEDGDELLAYIRNLTSRIYISYEMGEHEVHKKEWVIYCERLYNLLNDYEHESFVVKFLPDYAILRRKLFEDYHKCIEFYKKTLAFLKKDLANLKSISSMLSNLANIYGCLGDFDKATELLETALDGDISVFGESHPKIAIRLSNLGIVYLKMGQTYKAKELMEKALRMSINHLGQYHPDVFIRQSNLGVIYRRLGQYDKSVELLEATLKSSIIHFGLVSPSVANNLSSIINLLIVNKL